jgi:hypothetical protein
MVESFSLAPPHVPPPSPGPLTPPMSAPSPGASPPQPPPPPPPPGTYTRSCSCQLTGDWLAFVPPICVLLIFVPLSFFPWHRIVIESPSTQTLWGLAFVEWQANFVFYTILLLPAIFLTIASLPFDKGWIPPPAQVAPFLPLKNLVAGVILGLGFLMLLIDSLTAHFVREWNPQLMALKLAFCLQLIATVASFVMFWVNWRKKSNLPPPTCDMKW